MSGKMLMILSWGGILVFLVYAAWGRVIMDETRASRAIVDIRQLDSLQYGKKIAVRDPWGREYGVMSIDDGESIKKRFFSLGPDGKIDGLEQWKGDDVLGTDDSETWTDRVYSIKLWRIVFWMVTGAAAYVFIGVLVGRIRRANRLASDT